MCAQKPLDLTHPRIMGVLNVTPDSFSDGGRLIGDDGRVDVARVVHQAHEMIAAGAAVLDIGGESTRPGADEVSVAEELRRVIPVVEALREADTIISVDTRHAAVAEVALNAGAHMINDVSAGTDPDMLPLMASCDAAFVCMHMQGTPQTMQLAPRYDSVVEEVRAYLEHTVSRCTEAGIAASRLVLDPGFGFGKTLAHNLALLAGFAQLRVADVALLAGLSRKSMLGKITGREVGERVHASVAAALLAVERGADLVRVHDVAATADALAVYVAMQDGSAGRD